MTVSTDLRWRAIVLVYMYGIEMILVAHVLGVSAQSIERWHHRFKTNGNVLPNETKNKSPRWPPEAVRFVEGYIRTHPCFYLEELQQTVTEQFGGSLNSSTPTLCRLLRFDLNITRKVLTKRARESVPAEVEGFYRKLRPFYSGPDQLVFIDETSKDGRDSLRKYAWSRRNTPAIISMPFSRRERLSLLAAFDVTGFFLPGILHPVPLIGTPFMRYFAARSLHS
ncbi:unnamed protein product [Phytophthora fragariaefolia]|uniref:Unnamed protein product n=1 Tax=Phytophthora fragariaefolia TaxID=1490495 RepID=A0A9W6YB23_9STRA|nr:unnamed protein product [Phytophthora fragariaefolia]